MLFNKEIVGLHDDGFEGSIDEHQIFTEVFFGNDHDKTSKKCLVTGVINFECDKGKQTDGLLSPHSETSAITSQLDSSSVNCLKENSGPGCFSNGHALLARNDVIGNGKRIKLSVGEQSVFHSVTCHLVESSSHGITSSCYLLKGDVFKHRLASFNANDEKEICASKATPSPISQECSANKSRSLKSGGERIKKSKIDKLSGDQTLLNRDSMKDPRPLLRKYIQNLLRAKGWEIVRRIREDKVNGAFIYVSPQGGRRIHEFRRAWNLCGQSFSIDRTLVVLEDSKQWNDMAAFLSDLTNTLRKIDKELLDVETSSSLALQWCLLDPFVNLVFIDKKLGMLKVGEVVKARSSLLLDSYVKDDAILFLKDRDRIANQSQRGLPHGVCESSLIGGNVLMNTEANYGVCDDRCGTRITVDLGQLSRGRVKALNGVPVHLCEEKCTLSVITDGPNANSLQACGLDGNSDHSSSCLLEVPIISQTGNFVLGDNVSTPQDGEHSRFRSFVSPSHSSGEFNQFSHHCEQSKEFNFESEADAAPISLDPEFLRQDINSETPESQSGNVQKRPAACPIKDDDLLISAVIKNKTFRSTARKSIRNTKPYRSKPPRKRKTQKGSCRLLPRSLGKGGKHVEGKWFVFGSRTVLSWLISSGVVSLNEVIQYRNLKDDAVVKEGLISRDGILCKCCNKVLSISKFKFHAGFRLNRSCLNLVMGSGKLFALCQLEAWSDEYKARKSATKTVQDEEMDQNDDSCGLCGDGGELICCDNCPSTFHQTCLCEKELPVGSWYCQHCTCRICGDLVNDKEALESTGALKCSQCDHKYHEACLKGRGAYREVAYEAWFCDESCREVYIGLQSQVGRLNLLSDGFSWTLLRCIHGDQRVHSAERFVALKAECNSKLAVALTIMEECFLSMVDARTGIDMIPHVLYNWGSEFARLNYEGFYTLVLEKDDVLISAASIRIHGVTVAEMPLIATCSKYRRQGMCRRLMNSIEEMLKSFKVEKLVITAIPSLVETWTVGFGFEPLEDHERKGLSNINLMVFPGTVWLKKPMYKIQATDEQKRPDHAAPLSKDDGAVTGPCSDGVPILDFARQLNGSMSLEVVANETENGNTYGIMRLEREDALHEKGSNGLIVDFARQSSGSFSFEEAANETKNGHTNGTGQTLREDGLHEDFSTLSCEEPVLTEGQTHETVRQVEAVVIFDERGLSEGPCLDSIARLGKDKVAMASHVDSVVMYDARALPEMSCEAQPTSKLEEQFEMASHDSVVKYNERKVSDDEQLQEANILLDNER